MKGYNLDVWLIPKGASKKHLCFVRDDFASWERHVISTSVFLTLLFQKQCDILKGGWVGRGL